VGKSLEVGHGADVAEAVSCGVVNGRTDNAVMAARMVGSANIVV
jgi:hypothetical protein